MTTPLVFARTRVTHHDGHTATIERTGWLTPYAIEGLHDDCRHVGRAARLEVRVDADTPDRAVTMLQELLQGIARRGIRVRIVRDDFVHHPSAAA